MTAIDIKTTIDIDDYELDKRIIEAAAENLLSQLDLTARYGGTVPELIQTKLSEIVAEKIDAMLDKEVVQVDRWGDAVPGPKKTFRDVFADTAENFLTERVNSDGRTASGGYSSISRLEYLVRQVGLSSMDHECRAVAQNFKEELKKMAQTALAKVVADHVKRAA